MSYKITTSFGPFVLRTFLFRRIAVRVYVLFALSIVATTLVINVGCSAHAGLVTPMMGDYTDPGRVIPPCVGDPFYDGWGVPRGDVLCLRVTEESTGRIEFRAYVAPELAAAQDWTWMEDRLSATIQRWFYRRGSVRVPIAARMDIIDNRHMAEYLVYPYLLTRYCWKRFPVRESPVLERYPLKSVGFISPACVMHK